MAHSTRPTLPPLHTLDLPRGDIPHSRIHELYDDMNRRTAQFRILPTSPYSQRPQLSIPSTPCQKSGPPAPCLRPCTNAPTSTSGSTTTTLWKIRFVPTSLESADAVVFVPPPTAANAPPPSPLFLVGPALQRLRQPQRQLAKGARIHPYRIARGPSDRRSPTGPSHTQA